MTARLEHHAALDVTADVFPLTWVKTDLALERLPAGQVLRLTLNGGDALRDLPRRAKDEGHKVLAVQRHDDERYTLLIRSGGLR